MVFEGGGKSMVFEIHLVESLFIVKCEFYNKEGFLRRSCEVSIWVHGEPNWVLRGQNESPPPVPFLLTYRDCTGVLDF